MASASVKEFGKAWWSELYYRVIGAVVFLDNATAECLHWEGGLYNLLNIGAVAVKKLSPFEFCRKEDKKAVFITQTTWTQVQTICDIIKHSEFTHVIVVSCIGMDLLYMELTPDKDLNDKIAAGKAVAEGTKILETTLKEAFEGKECFVEIVHLPIFTISLTNVVFVTPPYKHVYPKCRTKLDPETNTGDLHTLLLNEKHGVRRLAFALNNMLDSMNLKEDIYYMGPYSAVLGSILENYSICGNRRKRCSHHASLIIVDRTLDLCGITSHSTESMLDKMLALLPRFPGHANDVAVDMSPLCEATNNFSSRNNPEESHLSPGCLYHANDDSCVQTFDYMINKSQKEVMIDLYNKLSKIDVQKSPSPKTLLKVTPQSFEKIITACKGNYSVIANHLGVLQQACAVLQTLKSPERVQLDLLMSLERQIQENIATSRDSTFVLQQVCHLIKTRSDRGLTLCSLMAVLVYIYSLKGKEIRFSKQHEDELQEVLSGAIFQEHKSLFREDSIDILPRQDCVNLAQVIVSRLKELGTLRASLARYNMLLKPSETGVGYEYKGILQQLVEDLVDSERPELYDLKHKDDSLVLKTKDLLRSGLNLLKHKKSRSAKHPLDNPTVIIFVMGGISADECKSLHRTVITSGIDNTVLIGSTKLVNPVDAMRDVLFFSSK